MCKGSIVRLVQFISACFLSAHEKIVYNFPRRLYNVKNVHLRWHMAGFGKKLSKRSIAAIITTAAVSLVIAALFIVNLFCPLKYLTAYLVSGSHSQSGVLTVHVLDVGQADCAIFELPEGGVLLIDGGDGSYSNNLKIIKKLNSLDIDYIDYLVCTSVNEEHCGGLAEIISLKDVGKIYMPYCTVEDITDAFSSFCAAAEECGAEICISETGAGEEEGDFFFTFLSPTDHTSLLSPYADLNASPSQQTMDDSSAVLWIEFAGTGIFWAGDVTSDILVGLADEYILLEEAGDCLSWNGHTIDYSKCAVVKVAKHGSEDSVCTELLNLLNVSAAIISVGEDNGEGCPSLQILADLYAFTGDVYITQHYGGITLTVAADGTLTIS